MSIAAMNELLDICPNTKGQHHFDVHWPPAGQYGYSRTICRYCGQPPKAERNAASQARSSKEAE
jgi:hypothetical protein